MTINLLALDTSSHACSVALSLNGNVQQAIELSERQHTRQILLQIQQLLDTAGITLGQLHAIAFSCGPGSFTGIRLAASLTQGLAFATGLPVIAVSSLQVIAQSAYIEHHAKQVAVASNAFAGQIYWGIYQLGPTQHMLPLMPDSICSPQHAVLSDDSGKLWVGAGDGWAVYKPELARLATAAVYEQQYPQARYVADLAVVAFRAGNFVTAESALPVYLYGAERWRKQTV